MSEAFFAHDYSRNLQVLLPNASDDKLCEMWCVAEIWAVLHL
jgi:hypothetical protein